MSGSRESPSALGFRLILIGLLLSIIGFVITTIGTANEIIGSPSPSTGIVIFIGPIPIVIGSGPQGPILIITGLIIAALMILLTTLFLRSRRIRPRIEPMPEGGNRSNG